MDLNLVSRMLAASIWGLGLSVTTGEAVQVDDDERDLTCDGLGDVVLVGVECDDTLRLNEGD